MKILKIIIDIALAVLPYIANKKKKNLEKELEIAKKTIEFLTKDKTPEEKTALIREAIISLSCVSNFRKRVAKKFDRAGDRFLKKLF